MHPSKHSAASGKHQVDREASDPGEGGGGAVLKVRTAMEKIGLLGNVTSFVYGA